MTINVVCRRDAINRNRLAPLALVFTHDRRRKFVGLGISEALVHWDFDKQQPTADCPDRAEIQFQITSKIREYEKKIKKLEVLEIPVTFDTLFEQNGKRINCTVGEYFKQIIERLEKVEKYSSASKHKVTLVLVSQFRSVNMRFDELDLTYLREFEIFLSQKGNVNNSCNYAAFQYCRLYLIEILHQTTTHCKCIQFTLCCILSKFYIKPQHEPLASHIPRCCILSKFYIKPQHEPLASHIPRCCILSKFYIKPQLRCILGYTALGCILSKFYIKPQQLREAHWELFRCILSKFYIKPQHLSQMIGPSSVVSYRNSTSNHNRIRLRFSERIVVSYRNSTSNHNKNNGATAIKMLYLIEILHQTTTDSESDTYAGRLYLIEILHQTTTLISVSSFSTSCILSKFYIKPQLPVALLRYVVVVSYRNSTSNHNNGCVFSCDGLLYLIEILHQTTTVTATAPDVRRCILSKFYIKPQLPVALLRYVVVVSYRNSTSNHNGLAAIPSGRMLYLIEILHQTTTPAALQLLLVVLYLIEILHQTTTVDVHEFHEVRCILSKFYIKPQRDRSSTVLRMVVSYRNSTSNHNFRRWLGLYSKVVSYRNSTSNHNIADFINAKGAVVSYRNSTSNHSSAGGQVASGLVVSYRNSTSNHNSSVLELPALRCILSKFYIKPQQLDFDVNTQLGCILSKFYIKPQPLGD